MAAVTEIETIDSIRFSFGKNTFDAHPKQREAASFAAFQEIVLRTRAHEKGLFYVAAPFKDGHRSRDSVDACRFISFDFDGIPSEDAFNDLRFYFLRYSGFGYTTASHTKDAPRARVILEADRAMTREERVRVSEAIQQQIEREIKGIAFDKSVYRGEQPIYTPMVSSITFQFEGEPVNVDAMLAIAPMFTDATPTVAKNLEAISTTDPVLKELLKRGMVKRDQGKGRYAVVCPCSDEHTSESGETSTAYTLPKFNGFDFGNFTCLHSHCKDRPQVEFMRALGLDHSQIRLKQAEIPNVDFSTLHIKELTKIETKKAEHEETRKKRFQFLTPGQLVKQQRVGWRVLDVIPKKGLIVMWGAPGSGKSFAAFDISASIARGIKYNGKRTKKGLVLIIAAEGDLTSRTMAYMREHDIQEGELDNLRVLQGSVNMLDPKADMQDLLLSIKEIVDASGEELAMVVVDTLNRVMPGGNENASEDMGAVINNAKLLEDAFHCAVTFIHHSGKDETKGTRGHSSLKGAMDAEISIVRNDEIRTFRIEKQKEGQDYYDLFHFKLKTVDLGAMKEFDPEAEPHERLTSCVLEMTKEVPQKKSGDSHNNGLLQAAILEAKTTAKEVVKMKFYDLHQGNAEAKRKAFNRQWEKYLMQTHFDNPESA